MKNSFQKVLAVVVLGLSITAGVNNAQARSIASSTKDSVTKDSARKDQVLRYWTNARVAAAQPRDFQFNATTQNFQLAAKGGKPSDGSSGVSWTAGGEVAKSVGKVLFTLGSTNYLCSASVVDDTVSSRSIIVTAAHCAYDQVNEGFSTNWIFVPDYDADPARLTANGEFCAETSLGCWVAESLVVSSDYAQAGGFSDVAVVHDYAFAVVGSGGNNPQQLDAAVGSQPITFTSLGAGADTWLFGYPAGQKYKGADLVYCRGALGFDPYMSGDTYRVPCDMTGGSSGGPWFSPFTSAGSNAGQGTVMSVNSYGYSGIKAMHGPKLNSETESMFSIALTTTENFIYFGD